MSMTLPATSSPEAALTVTVACWPTLTALMSDSERLTSRCMRLSWVSVMKPEDALDGVLEAPVLAPPVAPAPPDVPEAPDDPLLEEPDEPALTWSPTAPSTEATVAAEGA